MTTIQTERPQTVYALGHTPEEYDDFVREK